MSFRRILFACVFLFECFITNAQVNLQTGGATFSIPMFNWQDDKSRLTSSVVLGYSSGSGLKVDNIASNVGQGWDMIAGGVITRMQVGEPDDQKAFLGTGSQNDQDITRYPAGFLYAPVPAHYGCPSALTRYPIYGNMNQLYVQRLEVGEDEQLDHFSFQFNGKVGMFILDTTNGGIGRPLGDTKMKITFQKDTTMLLSGIRTVITSFTIQDVDGETYIFRQHGMTKVLQADYCDANVTKALAQPKFSSNGVYNQAGFDNGQIVNPWVISSWYLSEIDDSLANRKVIFNYGIVNTINNTAGADITYNSGGNYTVISHRTSITSTPELTSITYPDGHNVNFNFGSPRVDLVGENALASVDITYRGRYLSEYRLNTSYFILNRYGTPTTAYQKSVARLCLRSVTKIGVDLKEDTPPYIFDYYLGSGSGDSFVPPPFFYAKDIWGFYNGNNSVPYDNTQPNSAIPLNTTVTQLNNNQLRGLCFQLSGQTGVNLNAKSGYAQNGLLRQIIYPTGGTLTYQYAQNTGVINGTTGSTAVGGVHVSQTSSTDGNYSNGCSNPMVTNYNYVLSDEASSSLWGLEMPANSMPMSSYYSPEYEGYHFTWGCLLGCCYWHYQYPGILSQNEAINLPGFEKFMAAAAPVLGMISIVTDVLDVVNLCLDATPMAWVSVILDVVGSLLDTALSCLSNNTRTSSTVVYYNTDLNATSPLPAQFKRVEVTESSGAIGKTVYLFTSSDDYPIWFPTNPTFSAEQRFAPWAYGLPKLVTAYDASGNKVKETQNVYDTTYVREPIPPATCNECDWPNPTASCKCVVVNDSSERNTNWSNQTVYGNLSSWQTYSSATGGLLVNVYYAYTGRMNLDSVYERTYSTVNPSQYVQAITNYYYNTYENYEAYSVVSRLSNGDIIYKSISYPSDYTQAPLSTLTAHDIVTLPVETFLQVSKGGQGNAETLTEQVSEYTQLPSGDIKLSRLLEQRFASPNYTYYRYLGPGTATSPTYVTTKTFAYNTVDDPIGITDEGNRVSTSIFAYNDKYVVASVANATPLVDNPAYCSFEDSSSFGGWVLSGTAVYNTTTAVTGNVSLVLGSSNSLTAGSLNTAKPYILSFWSTTSSVSVSGGATLVKSAPVINGFTYYEYTIAQGTSSVTVSGTGIIDELRLYPKMARMRTTTYDPLIGKTSECDENSRPVYYSYDDLGRLQFIKDQYGNIVKMFEYNNVSAAKQNGCPGSYSNYATSEVFTVNNCGSGYVGSNVTYTVPAAKYTSTVSQADVDAQVEQDLLTNGQAYANTNGSCLPIYYNVADSARDSTQTCAPGQAYGAVTYTVPAGTYSSIISQADANQQAVNDVAANAQAYANSAAHQNCTATTAAQWSYPENGPNYCANVNGQTPAHLFLLATDINPSSPTYNQTQWFDAGPSPACPAGNYYNVAESETLTKNNCAAGTGSGTGVTYTVPAGTYSSTVSLAAANQLAINDVSANAQNYANTNGTCCQQSFTFTSTITGLINQVSLSNGIVNFEFSFQLPLGEPTSIQLGTLTGSCCFPIAQRTIPIIVGSTVFNLVIQTNGVVDLETIEGSVPTATTTLVGSYSLTQNAFYSVPENGTFTRNNCSTGQTGSTVTFTEQAYAFSSYISQADANQQAINAVTANGQGYANTNGTCSSNCSFIWATGTGLEPGSSTISESGSTGTFTLVFTSTSGSYSGGTLGTIAGGCAPSATRTVLVTDGNSSGRRWNVTITSAGVVSITLASGSPVTTWPPPVILNGTYSL